MEKSDKRDFGVLLSRSKRSEQRTLFARANKNIPPLAKRDPIRLVVLEEVVAEGARSEDEQY